MRTTGCRGTSTLRPIPTNSSSFGASTSSSAAPKLRLGHEGLRTARAKYCFNPSPAARLHGRVRPSRALGQPDDLTYVFYLRNGVNLAQRKREQAQEHLTTATTMYREM